MNKVKVIRCRTCKLDLDEPTIDGTPYEGLHACYNCDLYHDGTHWVPFEKVDALVDEHENDREFRAKPYLAKLNGKS